MQSLCWFSIPWPPPPSCRDVGGWGIFCRLNTQKKSVFYGEYIWHDTLNIWKSRQFEKFRWIVISSLLLFVICFVWLIYLNISLTWLINKMENIKNGRRFFLCQASILIQYQLQTLFFLTSLHFWHDTTNNLTIILIIMFKSWKKLIESHLSSCPPHKTLFFPLFSSSRSERLFVQQRIFFFSLLSNQLS